MKEQTTTNIPSAPSEIEQTPVLKCVGLTKHFGGLVAVNRVSFHINPGEVVGLVGDNGAGKSTMIQMISGVYSPDEGEMYVDGKKVSFSTPLDARNAGIETIYQDLALATNLNAADNIFLGKEISTKKLGIFPTLNKRKMQEEAGTILKELDIKIPGLTRPIRELSGGQRQAVAISRSIYWNAKLLIMDEPTAALGVPEQRKVYELVNKLKERGMPIIIISHNMRDVFAIADRIIVLRRGVKVADVEAHTTNDKEIVSFMVGNES
ncbi:MAG: sugar ABC transporter ATP-binding protein [Anaerolineaceae bacterium]|nr:sugar ABC transporter ATP-binding protein [Anaerolineaceae bacterium]